MGNFRVFIPCLGLLLFIFFHSCVFIGFRVLLTILRFDNRGAFDTVLFRWLGVLFFVFFLAVSFHVALSLTVSLFFFSSLLFVLVDVTDAEVRAAFTQCGEIDTIRLVYNKVGRSKE